MTRLEALAHGAAPSRTRMMSEGTLLGLVAVGALLSGGLALVSAPAPLQLGPPIVAHVTGLLAGYGVAVMVALMSRVPALEHGVGADRLSRWHGRGGRMILLLVLVHGVAATVGWAEAQGEGVVPALVQVLGFPGLMAATVGTAMLVAVGVASARAARRRLSYETWHLIHFSTYLAVALSFAHELAGPDLAGHPLVQVAWSLLYTLAFGLALRFRVLDPLLRAWRHDLRVDSVIDEGNGVTTLVLRGRYLAELEAQSGQFFRWRFLSTRTWHTANPFSLSAPPDDRFLRLTVKAVGDGTRAISDVRPGTRVLAEGPYGAMTERRRSGRGVLLVAGGVGITPMRALFESLDVPGDRLTLLYRASTEDEILFRDELEGIAARRGAQLLYLLGRSSDPATALTGARLRGAVPGVEHRDVYLCASPRFAEAVKAAVADAGVPRERLHTEEFVF